jgi:hypothetical protein
MHVFFADYGSIATIFSQPFMGIFITHGVQKSMPRFLPSALFHFVKPFLW